MPKIERDIPYTFSAYSGGALKPLATGGGQRARAAADAEEEGKDQTTEGKGKDGDGLNCDKRGEKSDFKDVYSFDEEEDESNEAKEPVCSISRQISVSASSRKRAAPLSVSCPTPLKKEANGGRRDALLDGRGRNTGSEAGLLVMAALAAAENDIMGEKGGSPECTKEESAKCDNALDEGAEKKKDKKEETNGDSDAAQTSQNAISSLPSETSATSTLSHSARSLLSERPRTPPREPHRKDDDDSVKSGAGRIVTDSTRSHPSTKATGSAPGINDLPSPPPQRFTWFYGLPVNEQTIRWGISQYRQSRGRRRGRQQRF